MIVNANAAKTNRDMKTSKLRPSTRYATLSSLISGEFAGQKGHSGGTRWRKRRVAATGRRKAFASRNEGLSALRTAPAEGARGGARFEHPPARRCQLRSREPNRICGGVTASRSLSTSRRPSDRYYMGWPLMLTLVAVTFV
jgi:hypothetical protein